MPYNYSNKERLNQLYAFSNAYNSTQGKRLRESDSVFDVATFAVNLAAEKYARFWNNLTAIFPDCKINYKSNVLRIAQKLEELQMEKGCTVQESWMHITDLVRLQIFAKNPDEVMRIWQKVILPRGNTISVTRIKPRFNHFLNDMIINFTYSGKLIGELQIKLGDGRLPRGYQEQHFIYECLRAVKSRDSHLLSQCISKRMNDLADEGKLNRDGYTGATDSNPLSVQGMMKDKGQDHTKHYDKGRY